MGCRNNCYNKGKVKINKNAAFILSAYYAIGADVMAKYGGNHKSHHADYEPIRMKGLPGICKHKPKNRKIRMKENRRGGAANGAGMFQGATKRNAA
jgi:hypothetical protein